MPPLSLLIKPASSNCNLRCKYCFYHSIAESRTQSSYGIMSRDMLEILVKKALEYAEGSCTFAFQGGEPTLAGLDFYKELVELQKKYNSKNVKINNSIQTNGMVIDDQWSRFLAANKFLVGISLDGPKDIHDMNRVDTLEAGSFNQVMNTIGLFNEYGVDYNILTVVNAVTARHISKVYNFFKKNNFKYLQFIPCLDPLNEMPGGQDYSLTPARYSRFLNTLFDLWYQDFISGNGVSIRYFDDLTDMLTGYPPSSCGMAGFCTCYYVVEADGSTYPCDFYVIDEWYLGNIRDSGFDEMRKSQNGIGFVEVSKNIDPECRKCRHFQLCRGGCRRTREPFENGKPILNYYCSAYKDFFDHSEDRLKRIAQYLVRRNG